MAHPQAAVSRPPARRPRRGFTLFEMLVTIGIVSALIGIALPVILGARNSAKKSAIGLQLQMIATGLEAYKADWGGYPPVEFDLLKRAVGDTGAFALCRYLIAPASDAPVGGGPGKADEVYDLKSGAGFRTKPGGKVYGPYLLPDNFRFGLIKDTGGGPLLTETGYTYTPRDWSAMVVVDKSNKPILYAPTLGFRPKFTSTTPTVYYAASRTLPAPPVSTPGTTDVLFFDTDGLTGVSTVNTPELTDYRKTIFQVGETDSHPFELRVRRMLGDADADGRIGSGETPAFATAPLYLLWSAGVDGVYGDINGKTPDDVIVADGSR